VKLTATATTAISAGIRSPGMISVPIAGHPAATLALRTYGPELYGFLAGQLQNNTDADEVFSQLTEDLWRGLPAFDVNRETDNYYQRYMEILGYCGWVQNYSEWRQYTSSSSSLEISQVLIDLLTGLLTGKQLELLQTALTVLQTAYKSNEQIRLLGKDNAADKEVNFDLGVVGQDSHTWPTFKPVFFAISAESETVNILFTTLKSSQTSVFYATSDQTLDMSHYAMVQAAVEAKTEEAAKNYIENLAIAN